MRLLIDTTVLVDFLRGHPRAVRYMGELELKPFVSAMTVAELYGGIREGVERQTLDRVLTGCEPVPIDDMVAEKGGLMFRKFSRSHGVGLADALIAACADVVSAQLVTHNRRHFPMLAEVLVPYGE
ncbi:MAG: type II toxin-antitoxin system VapC family toxin [Hyphomicrobiales bacterium]